LCEAFASSITGNIIREQQFLQEERLEYIVSFREEVLMVAVCTHVCRRYVLIASAEKLIMRVSGTL
jgi:hypothetical protein